MGETEVRMSKVSTSLLFAGPSGVGPFHSPDWRVCWSANLVEGGSNGPFWLPLPSFEDQRSVNALMIDSNEPELVAQSLILLVSAVFGSENLLGLLLETHNITEVSPGEFSFAPFWELTPEVVAQCVSDLDRRIRLGFVQLDDLGIFDLRVIEELAKKSIQIDAFVSAPTSSIVERL